MLARLVKEAQHSPTVVDRTAHRKKKPAKLAG
jgi:hypothetical protein